MKITREQAIAVLRYQVKHPDYKFPLDLMSFEYGKDNPCDNEGCEEECQCRNGIEPDDYDTITNFKEYINFEVRSKRDEDEATVEAMRAEELKKFDVYPAHACQHCGSESKRVQTLIDDRASWNEEAGEFQYDGFSDDFTHTGQEVCTECSEDWTGL